MDRDAQWNTITTLVKYLTDKDPPKHGLMDEWLDYVIHGLSAGKWHKQEHKRAESYIMNHTPLHQQIKYQETHPGI